MQNRTDAENRVLTLYHWCLTEVGGHVIAKGNVTGHPKLDNGLYIHTSRVEQAECLGDALLLTTQSGSHYTLLPEAIAPEHREKTEHCLHILRIDPGFAAHGIQARLAAEARRQAEAERTLAPGQLLLEVVGNRVVRAFFRAGEEPLLPVEPLVHWGYFEDSTSVLITDWEGGRVDFRYFPRKNQMKPYHISDGLHEIVIHNLGGADVAFGQEETAQLCRAGEMTAVRAADHADEWLFSPDAVNGKCLPWITLEDKEDKSNETK